MIDLHGHIASERGAQAATALHEHLVFRIMPLSSHLYKVSIDVHSTLVKQMVDQCIELFRHASFDGFSSTTVPKQHIADSYKHQIIHKVKNYLFNHLVLDFILAEILNRKLVMANFPRLAAIEVLPDLTMIFHFDVSIADTIELKEWKHFAFKSPKRKRYKDLDKQVIAFVDNRNANNKKVNMHAIEENDWVLIATNVVDTQGQLVHQELSGLFWIKVGEQEITPPLISQLLGRQVDGSFYSTDLDIRESEDSYEKRAFKFLVTIKSVIKGSVFSLETFKTTFKLKNKNDIHNKLMEVFSYRNDVSQRKSIIEEVFHLLLSKHRFEIPKHLVLRREEFLLEQLMRQPDYHVYRAQKDFETCIQQLAEKQLKEEIVIDHIAHHENIKIDLRDMHNYLHLLSNKKLKEFIYFKPLSDIIDDYQVMINVTALAQTVAREKTLNHIIHALTH